MIHNYKMILSYDGTRYKGWQKQGNTENTIQGKLETILSDLFVQKIELHGSGRTDAGVHALAQCASFKADTDLSPETIRKLITNRLPEDIGLLKLEEVDIRFHARLSAKGKRYIYKVRNTETPDVFCRKYEWNVREPLDIDLIRQAVPYFLGAHDFKAFCTIRSNKKSTVRTITAIDITKENDLVLFTFEGDGFLYNMVRLLMGTLLAVGKKEITPEKAGSFLNANSKAELPAMAPGCGLFLAEVFYE